MAESQIEIAVENYVAVITMNNPPVNAQGQQFHEDMMSTMDGISDRDDIRVAILTGAGKCFSAGADLKAKANRTGAPGEAWQHNRRARECFHAIVECRKPIIGAINGPALGAGLAIAASCDILVASENASLGLPEINVGLLGGVQYRVDLCNARRIRPGSIGIHSFGRGQASGCILGRRGILGRIARVVTKIARGQLVAWCNEMIRHTMDRLQRSNNCTYIICTTCAQV